MDRLQAQINRLTQRTYLLENPSRQEVASAPAAEPASEIGTTEPEADDVAAAAIAAADDSAPAPIPVQHAKPAARDWEWLLGGNWLARIGILALIIGAGFFLNMAIDNEWIGETGRVVLGVVIGALLAGGGEYWARRYPRWSQAVTGGGIAIWYLSIFAASALYGLFSSTTALALIGVITVGATGLALRYESPTVAVLGILGGFATPLMLAESLPGEGALLVYVLVLDLGVLALAAFRNWRWFTLLALAGSLILFGYWHEERAPDLLLAEAAITAIFLIFVGATTLFHVIWRRIPVATDQLLIVLNGIAYFGISYGLLFEDYRDWMGAFTVLLASFYGLLGYGFLAGFRDQARLSFFTFGMAAVFLAIAIPVQFDGPWIAIAWTVQATFMIWLSFFRGIHQLRWAAVAIFGVIVFGLLFLDIAATDLVTQRPPDTQFRLPVLNWDFQAFLVPIVGIYISAYLAYRWRGSYVYPWDRHLGVILLVAANGLSLFGLSNEIAETVERASRAADSDAVDNAVSLSLSALWSVYAAGLIVLGLWRRSRGLRRGGLGLLAVPVVKLFIYDAFNLDEAYRVAVFVGLGVLLIAGGFAYQRFGRAIRGAIVE